MKDHKRKARPIAAATVHTGDGWIEVVVPDVLGKNESHSRGQGAARSRFLTQATRNYRESVRLAVSEWRSSETTMSIVEGRMSLLCDSQAMGGAWRLEVLGVWPRQRNTIGGYDLGFVAPMGDADAAISQALDALQHAEILDDDARVVEVRAWNLYRKDVRCTVIRLVRVDDLAARDAAIAHLVSRVPAAPTSAPKQRRLNPRKETPCTTTSRS